MTDVFKWYAINRYSTDPLSRDYAKHPAEDQPKRSINYGLFSGEKSTIFAPGWMSYDEQFLTKGSWVTKETDKDPIPEITAQKLYDEYAQDKAQGKSIYPYTRQIRGWYAYHEDRPPYKRWLLLSKHGFPFSYNLGAAPFEKQIAGVTRLSENQCRQIGVPYSDGYYIEVHDDFCAPDLVDWYVGQHVDYLKHYPIDGFYFDMGWDTHVAPCWRHPKSGIFHGELKAVAEITNAGRAMSPGKRFFMNQNIHSPCMDLMDGVYINEGGVGINKLAADSVKFNRCTFSNLIYDGQWEQFYGKAAFKDQIVLKNMRNLSYGVLVASDQGEFQRKAADGSLLYKDYIDLMKQVNPMSLIYENDAIVFVDAEALVTGSVWADSKPRKRRALQ